MKNCGGMSLFMLGDNIGNNWSTEIYGDTGISVEDIANILNKYESINKNKILNVNINIPRCGSMSVSVINPIKISLTSVSIQDAWHFINFIINELDEKGYPNIKAGEINPIH